MVVAFILKRLLSLPLWVERPPLSHPSHTPYQLLRTSILHILLKLHLNHPSYPSVVAKMPHLNHPSHPPLLSTSPTNETKIHPIADIVTEASRLSTMSVKRRSSQHPASPSPRPRWECRLRGSLAASHAEPLPCLGGWHLDAKRVPGRMW